MAKINLTNYYDDVYEQQKKQAQALADTQKQQVNQSYDTQLQKLENDANKNVIAAGNSYDAAYADNEVQRAINERNIRASMSAAGLQDSGLNRTQTTAVNLQKANADAKVTMQKMNFINSIKSQLAENQFSLEQSRINDINSINNQLNSDINNIENEKATARMNKQEEIINTLQSITDPSTAAGYIKTVSKQYGIDGSVLAAYTSVLTKNQYAKYLENENYFKNKTSFQDVKSTLAGIDTTTAAGLTVAAKQIKAWTNQSGKSATKSQLKKLLAAAGISYAEYNKFLKDGQYFKKIEEQNALEQAAKKANSSSGSSGGGRSKKSSSSSPATVNVNLDGDDDDDNNNKNNGNDGESSVKNNITQKYPSVFMKRGFTGAYAELEKLYNDKKISDADYEAVVAALKTTYQGSMTDSEKEYIKKKYGISL